MSGIPNIEEKAASNLEVSDDKSIEILNSEEEPKQENQVDGHEKQNKTENISKEVNVDGDVNNDQSKIIADVEQTNTVDDERINTGDVDQINTVDDEHINTGDVEQINNEDVGRTNTGDIEEIDTGDIEQITGDVEHTNTEDVEHISSIDGAIVDIEHTEQSAVDESDDGQSQKLVDDLVSTVDEIPLQPVELEDLDPKLTPPPPEGDDDDDAKENDSHFGDEELDEEGNSSEISMYDREQLLQQYKEALEERARIQQINQQYQHKLAEYFKKKKSDDKTQELDKNVTDQEQRYLKYMSNLEELQAAEARQTNSFEQQLEELKGKCHEKLNKVDEITASFMAFKYEVAKNSVNSRSGKTILQTDLDQYQIAEQKKDSEVVSVRLENIKLKNRLKKRKQQLKAKEELAEGLHLIDFEQLKIENQTYNEKIEERNDELLKLRKKINTTVQVLTHLKEKLQHLQGENGERRIHLREIDGTVAKKRDLLTRLKQSRDSLRFDNSKLKHKAGLLGNVPLLRDFEVRKNESEELLQKIGELKERHFELNLMLSGVRKKIENTKEMR